MICEKCLLEIPLHEWIEKGGGNTRTMWGNEEQIEAGLISPPPWEDRDYVYECPRCNNIQWTTQSNASLGQ